MVLEMHILLTLHKFDWMAQSLGAYSEDIAREFYASYVDTLLGSLDRRPRPAKQDPLKSTLVCGCRVDIFEVTIFRFFDSPIIGPHTTHNSAEVDYRWQVVQSIEFGKSFEHRAVTMKWQAQYIATDA